METLVKVNADELNQSFLDFIRANFNYTDNNVDANVDINTSLHLTSNLKSVSKIRSS